MSLNLSPTKPMTIDIGKGDLYQGKPYPIPYFFEKAYLRMMREPDSRNVISFKTWKGEYFQFYLDRYHSSQTLVLTSTLRDSVFISPTTLSIEKSAEKFKETSQKSHPIKNSFSGYFKYGTRIAEQYAKLFTHLAEQEIYFSDETVKWVYKELKRRAKYE